LSYALGLGRAAVKIWVLSERSMKRKIQESSDSEDEKESISNDQRRSQLISRSQLNQSNQNLHGSLDSDTITVDSESQDERNNQPRGSGNRKGKEDGKEPATEKQKKKNEKDQKIFVFPVTNHAEVPVLPLPPIPNIPPQGPKIPKPSTILESFKHFFNKIKTDLLEKTNRRRMKRNVKRGYPNPQGQTVDDDYDDDYEEDYEETEGSDEETDETDDEETDEDGYSTEDLDKTDENEDQSEGEGNKANPLNITASVNTNTNANANASTILATIRVNTNTAPAADTTSNNVQSGDDEIEFEQDSDPKTKKRGRPRSTNNGQKSLKVVAEITEKDIDTFLSIIFSMMQNPQRTLAKYWKPHSVNENHGSFFIKKRMGKDRFLEILRCLDFGPDFLLEEIVKVFQESWSCSRDLASDESISPFQGLSPHHMYIPNKPWPNGTKFYTVADSSTYFHGIVLHKRTNQLPEDPIIQNVKRKKYKRQKIDKETTIEIEKKLLGHFPPGHHVSLDSYYGGPDMLCELTKLGFRVSMTCKSNRPSAVFADVLKKNDFPHFGVYHSAYGYIKTDTNIPSNNNISNNGANSSQSSSSSSSSSTATVVPAFTFPQNSVAFSAYVFQVN